MTSLFLSPLSAPIRGGAPTVRRQFQKPRGFRPIEGTPEDVAFTSWKHPRSSGNTAAQKAGLRYEKKVHEALADTYSSAFHPHPSISFRDRSGPRLAVPDGLLRIGDSVAIVEIKYSHCELAWWQLRKLYEPLVQRLTTSRVLLLEIVNSYDPAVEFPEPHQFIPSLSHPFILTRPIGVHQWKL